MQNSSMFRKPNGRKLSPNLAFFLLLLFFFNLMRRKSFCFGFSFSFSFADPEEHKELISMPCLHSVEAAVLQGKHDHKEPMALNTFLLTSWSIYCVILTNFKTALV